MPISKTSGHSLANIEESKGDPLAAAAKSAALQIPGRISPNSIPLKLFGVIKDKHMVAQQLATQHDKEKWVEENCRFDSKRRLWIQS